jgi:hypothetical protein
MWTRNAGGGHRPIPRPLERKPCSSGTSPLCPVSLYLSKDYGMHISEGIKILRDLNPYPVGYIN